jgi:hypothetical protein
MTSRRRVCEALSFAVVAIFCSAMLQLTQAAEIRQIKVPHNAFAKFARDDLLTPLRRQGEVRVIVGMQTPQEVAQPADLDADELSSNVVYGRHDQAAAFCC